MPVSITTSSGNLYIPKQKSALSHIQADNHTTKTIPDILELTCVIIDAMALLRAIGKPRDAQTFGDVADTFSRVILSHCTDSCSRLDVVYDVYMELSTKDATRDECSKIARNIRHVIDSRDVSLPANWEHFINLRDNKTNLIQFLCQQLFIKADDLDDKQIVVAGGLDDPIKTMSSTGRNVDHLYSSHEEADQQMILHAVDTKEMGFVRTVISSRYTDVLMLFIHHYAQGKDFK